MAFTRRAGAAASMGRQAATRLFSAVAGHSTPPSGYSVQFTVHRSALKTSQITYDGFSGEVPFTLVLPEKYDKAREGGHPLLVYLAGPGFPDTTILEPQQLFGFMDPSDLKKSQINGIMSRAEAADLPLAVLCATCAGHPQMVEMSNSCGRWADWTNGSANWETFTVKELLPHVRSEYNVGSDNPAEMAISGISSAGQGALRFGLKHPDVFGVVCGLSAAITPTVTAAGLYRDHPNIPFSWANEEVVFADANGELNEDDFHANNVISIASNPSSRQALLAHGTKILMDCGGRDELFPYAGAEMLHRVLADNGIEHEYRLGLHGTHIGSDAFERDMYAIDFILKHMRRHMRGTDPFDAALAAHMNQVADAGLAGRGIEKLSHAAAMSLVGQQMM
eukprot:Hpha_TRINITY_DN13062_c0_g1::TRINITY_DN13062_c0_g1_i1::g.69220::m.69220